MNFFETTQGKAFIDVAVEAYENGEEIYISPLTVANRVDIENTVKTLRQLGRKDAVRKAVSTYLNIFELMIAENCLDLSKFKAVA